jgi:outer membrane protein TolC
MEWKPPMREAMVANLPLAERKVPAPDVSALPDDAKDKAKEKAQQPYYNLTAEECRALACRNSSVGNLVEATAPQYTWSGCNIASRYASDWVRRTAASYISAEARNRNAGAALNLYYRILELELKSDVLNSSIAEMDALVKANDVLAAKGFKQATDSHELKKQRIDLEAKRATLRSGLQKLNAELKNLLAIDPGTAGFILPADQVKVVPDPLDAEQAVALGLNARNDLNLLRAVGNMTDHRTVPAVRQVMIGVVPALAGVMQVTPHAPQLLPFVDTVAKAEANAVKKQILGLLIDREREAAKDIRTAIEEWTTARELVSIARQRFELNQSRVKELETRAKVGQSVEIELRKARLELLEAEADLIGEIAKWKLADVKAREVIGLLCDECGR